MASLPERTRLSLDLRDATGGQSLEKQASRPRCLSGLRDALAQFHETQNYGI